MPPKKIIRKNVSTKPPQTKKLSSVKLQQKAAGYMLAAANAQKKGR